MSVVAKKWLMATVKALGIVAPIWVVAWYFWGANVALGVVAVVIALGLIGTLVTWKD